MLHFIERQTKKNRPHFAKEVDPAEKKRPLSYYVLAICGNNFSTDETDGN